MAKTLVKYAALQQAILDAPEYFSIADKDRPACKSFLVLASTRDPDPAEIETAYQAALMEAQQLAIRGALTITLPEDAPEPRPECRKTKTEQPRCDAVAPEYTVHPAASIFPMMADPELDELASDIGEHGLEHPIVRYKNQVLDGRNRLEACRRAGVEPKFTEWSGKGSMVQWILSMNLHRRHLSDSQRAVIAAKVAQELTVEGKQRSARNLRNSGSVLENRDPESRAQGSSAEKAAKLLNVSRDATAKAATVVKKGSKKLVDAVTEGKVSLDAASKVATLPQKKQEEVLAKNAVKETAKKLREEKATTKANSNKVDSANKAKDPVPVTATEPIPTRAPAKPTTTPAKEPKPVEGHKSETPPSKVSGAVRLLKEVHEALDAMVLAASAMGRRERVEILLTKIFEYINKVKAEFEKKS